MTDSRPLRVHGIVGELGVVSVDNRRVRLTAFAELPEQIPLMAKDALGPGHAGAYVAGELHSLRIDGGLVYAEGSTSTLAPGKYPCGMDLANVDVQLVMPDGSDVPPEVWDQWFGVEPADRSLALVEDTLKARLLGVTCYGPDSQTAPAFSAALLTVEPFEEQPGS